MVNRVNNFKIYISIDNGKKERETERTKVKNLIFISEHSTTKFQ